MLKDFFSLTKPRIALMVMLTAAVGVFLAGGTWHLIWPVVIGTGLAAGACGTLNQWLEQKEDGLMHRTCHRPLPAGRIKSSTALGWGIVLGVMGVGVLTAFVNVESAGLTLLTMVLYLACYTPLKKITSQSTWIGAIAGALPPMVGWVAVTGTLEGMAWMLFAIQLLWQIPHFLAMFWNYRDDYARAGFKVMPVVDPGGSRTAFQIAIHTFALLMASMLPTLMGKAGLHYGIAAMILGTAYLAIGMKASWTMALPDTKRLFRASLAYLPLIFLFLMLGGDVKRI